MEVMLMVSKTILLKKVRNARAQSAAIGAEVALGPIIPQGMKMYVTKFRAKSTGAVTTLNVTSGIVGTLTQTAIFTGLPILASNVAGANELELEGDVDNPVFIVEPTILAGVRGNTTVYIGDGGVRVEADMEYYVDY